MFDLDSDRFIDPAEETRKFLDTMGWDKIAEELTRWSRSASVTSTDAMSPIVTEVREDKEKIEMEKIEKDTEALVDNLANYKDSYITDDDIRSIYFDDGTTSMLVPVGVVIDKLIDFLIS